MATPAASRNFSTRPLMRSLKSCSRSLKAMVASRLLHGLANLVDDLLGVTGQGSVERLGLDAEGRKVGVFDHLHAGGLQRRKLAGFVFTHIAAAGERCSPGRIHESLAIGCR